MDDRRRGRGRRRLRPPHVSCSSSSLLHTSKLHIHNDALEECDANVDDINAACVQPAAASAAASAVATVAAAAAAAGGGGGDNVDGLRCSICLTSDKSVKRCIGCGESAHDVCYPCFKENYCMGCIVTNNGAMRPECAWCPQKNGLVLPTHNDRIMKKLPFKNAVWLHSLCQRLPSVYSFSVSESAKQAASKAKFDKHDERPRCTICLYNNHYANSLKGRHVSCSVSNCFDTVYHATCGHKMGLIYSDGPRQDGSITFSPVCHGHISNDASKKRVTRKSTSNHDIIPESITPPIVKRKRPEDVLSSININGDENIPLIKRKKAFANKRWRKHNNVGDVTKHDETADANMIVHNQPTVPSVSTVPAVIDTMICKQPPVSHFKLLPNKQPTLKSRIQFPKGSLSNICDTEIAASSSCGDNNSVRDVLNQLLDKRREDEQVAFASFDINRLDAVRIIPTLANIQSSLVTIRRERMALDEELRLEKAFSDMVLLFCRMK